MDRPTGRDHDDVVVRCPSGAYPFVAEVPLTLRRGPVVRYPCEKCRYAVWRYGLGGKWDGQSIPEKAVLVQHRFDSVTGEVIGNVVSIFPERADNRPGKGGVPVEEPTPLLRRSVAEWNRKSAGGPSTPTSSTEEHDREPE